MAPAAWQELPGTFEASRDTATERVQRRLEYVLRHLEWRITEADRLRDQIDETHAELDAMRQQLGVQSRETDAWRQAYEAVMATKTMRAAHMPRTLYARFRGGSRL